MLRKYEAHPLEHAGDKDLMVEFEVSDAATAREAQQAREAATDEVARKERAAGIKPPMPVVISLQKEQPSVPVTPVPRPVQSVVRY